MSVTIQVYNQMQTIWMTIAVLVGVVPVVVVCILWFVKNYMRSKSGKLLDNVKSGHKQLLLASTPSHRANLFKVSPFVPGVLQTTTFDKRVEKKRKVFYEAEKTSVALEVSDLSNAAGLSDDEKKQRLSLTQECLDFVLENNTKKVFIEDSIPLTLAVEDKVITAGVPGIGGMAYIEKLFRINGLADKISAMEDSPTFKEVGIYLKNLASQLTVIDIDLLRSYFNSDWNQSNDDIKHDLHWTMGYREKNKGEHKFEKWIIIGGLVMGIGGMVGGIVFAYLFGKK